METVVQLTPTDALPDDKRAAISAIKEGKFGISVETYDKVKALELIGRHLGMFADKPDGSRDGDEGGVVILAPVIQRKDGDAMCE